MSRVTKVLLLLALVMAPARVLAGTRGPMPVTAIAPATPQAADVLEECTIAVIGGQSAADGRPILWKNRDAGFTNNELAYFDDGVYPYITIINAGDQLNAWIGVNEPGFAVLNALSYNIPDSLWGGMTNGQLMKLALQTCATVDDFERLLNQTAHQPGRENPANLAVIDAQGGAAIFEVGSRHHHRFDASGPNAVAGGFLVRANFSLSSDTLGIETWRFRRATDLTGKAVRSGGAKRGDLFRFARDLVSESCNPYPLPYAGSPPGYPAAIGYADTYETIQRVSTVASGLIQGVRPGEDPRLSTFFVALGKPAVAPFVPAWVAGGPTPPELDGPLTAPFCDLARVRAQDCYDYGASWRLVNTWKLAAPYRNHPSYLELLRHVEQGAHARVDSMLTAWRIHGVSPADVSAQEKLLSAAMYREYVAGSGVGGGSARMEWRVSPNPMHEGTGILAVPGDGSAAVPSRIEIFDVAGHRVAHLEAMGSLGFAWDGRDEFGRLAPTGLYFARAQGTPSSARILLIR